MENKYLPFFMEYMQNQNEFYYSFLNCSNESIVDIFPSKRCNVTRYKKDTQWI